MPKMMRERMSRPSSSVPIQWAAVGAREARGKFWAVGIVGREPRGGESGDRPEAAEGEAPAARAVAAQEIGEFVAGVRAQARAAEISLRRAHSKRTRGSTNA